MNIWKTALVAALALSLSGAASMAQTIDPRPRKKPEPSDWVGISAERDLKGEIVLVMDFRGGTKIIAYDLGDVLEAMSKEMGVGVVGDDVQTMVRLANTNEDYGCLSSCSTRCIFYGPKEPTP